MALTTRQQNLVAENWDKIYNTFRTADFTSYDFETLRKSLIDTLRLYYPEDFNDFIESSEYVALIDLISFLGQSLAFRGDLNARENYLDTAERRDSILKLAKLVSYNAKRNTAASGLLKIDSVSTTEDLFDSDGINLSGLVIDWDDASNSNWLEQFTLVLNASLNTNQSFGIPANSKTISGIKTDEYQINTISNTLPVYSFDSTVAGSRTNFEIVSATTGTLEYIYEVPPLSDTPLTVLYRNDGFGNSSVNTGFFTYIKQGRLQSRDVFFSESIPNRVYSIDVNNVNSTDIWVVKLNSDGTESEMWGQVPIISVSNNIYTRNETRNVFQVSTKALDQVDIVFGDGVFATIPTGPFRVYFRTSNGLDYKISPNELQGIVTNIDYVSRNGRQETLTITSSLKYTIANASSRETLSEIKNKAPQQWYTQDRMITGEDYNILPYTKFNNILKVKSVNRTSSGISRYLDITDPTGKYSSTNIFSDDGILYTDESLRTFEFSYNSKNDVNRIITNNIYNEIASKEVMHMIRSEYSQFTVSNTKWKKSSNLINGSTGYFSDLTNNPVPIGTTVTNSRRVLTPGVVIKFSAGAGKFFDSKGNIQTGVPTKTGESLFVYAKILTVTSTGLVNSSGVLSDGNGTVAIDQFVPSDAIIESVLSAIPAKISSAVITNIIDLILQKNEFGIRYKLDTGSWEIIQPLDLNLGAFSLINTGDTTSQNRDSSWIIKVSPIGETKFKIEVRGKNYIFASLSDTQFYFDVTGSKIYDPTLGKIVTDTIKVLNINSGPDSNNPLTTDYDWTIYSPIVLPTGYTLPNGVKVTFPDLDVDGTVDIFESFNDVISPLTNPNEKFVYFLTDNGIVTYINSNSVVSIYNTYNDVLLNIGSYLNSQLFYIPSINKFYKLVTTPTPELVEQTKYTAKVGRDNIKFQYIHNSSGNRRIDPSPSNLIDVYVLTKSYARDYTAWVTDTVDIVNKPVEPTQFEISELLSDLENYKSVSDTMIFNNAKIKLILGSKADQSLQATIKIIKNPIANISDNDIKTSVISAINTFFDFSNWDFGETFYFSELSSYIHQTLSTIVSGVTITPKLSNSTSSLLQIAAEFDEIILGSVTANDIEIVQTFS